MVSSERYMVTGFVQRKRIKGDEMQKNLRVRGFKFVFSINFRQQTL